MGGDVGGLRQQIGDLRDEVLDVTVAYESLNLPGDPDQTLITYTAEDGSPSQAVLKTLIERHHARAEPARRNQ